MGSYFVWSRDVNAWRFTHQNAQELHKQKDDVRSLCGEPCVRSLVIRPILVLISNSEHPPTILASLDRDWKKALCLLCYQVIVRLMGAILNRHIVSNA